MKRLAIDLLLFGVIGLAVLLLIVPAHGETCATVRTVQTHQAAAVVNAHEIVYPSNVVVTPLAVAVPQYSAQYAGLPPEVLLLLQQMGARLDSIDRQLAAPQGAVSPQASPLQPSPPLGQLAAPAMPAAADQAAPRAVAGTPKVYAHCASCHSGTAAKGGNHVLFANGQPLAWDCGQIGEIMDRTMRPPNSKGVMPPDGGSDEDAGEILEDCKARLHQAAKR